jgi:hypothetical protein
MGQTKDFRTQSSAPTTPTATDKVAYYVNNSGILHFVNYNGAAYQANQLWANSISMLGQTLMGNPTSNGFLSGVSGFLPVVGPSGQRWAIPVWTVSGV